MVRMANCDRTCAYVAKRTADGKSKKEIIRCLQRFVAREIHSLLTKDHATINGADLRHRREHAELTLSNVADALNTWPIAISRLERGITHNPDLATRYNHWLQHAA